MFFIPGPVIALITFPGIIVHETAHLLFCKVFRIPVFDVCYFRLGNPAGYVLHQKTDRFVAIFFVCLGPFFINTALCIVFCSVAFLPVWVLKVGDIFAYFFYWLGISIGMHSFPSSEDLTNLYEVAPAEAKRFNPLAILSLPLIYVLFVLNLARFVWADLGYGLAVGILAPIAIFRAVVR
jgi:hypothetical protein